MLLTTFTSDAPVPAGPYSQGLVIDPGVPMVVVSGQLPVDPGSGRLVTGYYEQTCQALANALAVVRSACGTYHDVVQVSVYLTDLLQVSEVNRAYAEAFPDWHPARVMLGVSELPMRAFVEISVMAQLPPSGQEALR